MKSLSLFFGFFFLFVSIPHIAFANVFFADSVEYRQPNDVTFTGREWGDEFFFQRRTQDFRM